MRSNYDKLRMYFSRNQQIYVFENILTSHNGILLIKKLMRSFSSVLQMAKAAPQYQEVLGYYRECCENTNLIGNHSLLPCCYRAT